MAVAVIVSTFLWADVRFLAPAGSARSTPLVVESKSVGRRSPATARAPESGYERKKRAMDHLFTNVWEGIIARVTGPMKFRLVLQPAMSIFLAIRRGLKDAREGNPPYFWGLFTDPKERDLMLKDGWKSVSRVFILGVVMDVIYQIIETRSVHVIDALLVAFVLAILPYLIFRGPVNRLARRFGHRDAKERLAGD